MNNVFLTDKDVLAILRISRKTLVSILQNGPNAACSVDLRKARPCYFGTGGVRPQRRWPVGTFAAVTGLSYEEIWSALA